MRYMKNDPYLNQHPRGGDKKDNNNNPKIPHDSSQSSSNTIPYSLVSSSSSSCQNNRLFAFLRRGDWSAAFERCQSHPQEAHHNNVDLSGNTALHLAFHSSSSSHVVLPLQPPPLHLIDALLSADVECASTIVASKNSSSSSSSLSSSLSSSPLSSSIFSISSNSSSSTTTTTKKASCKRGTTPLHLAVCHRTSPAILSLLISANPSAADTLDDVGRTPLHRACSSIAIGGGTGDLNEHYYANNNNNNNNNHNNNNSSDDNAGTGLLPMESFQLLVNATTCPKFLLKHKDDRGYTALSYLSRRFEERAVWAVDHMRSACAAAAETETEEDESDDDDDDYNVNVQRIAKTRRSSRRRRFTNARNHSSATLDYSSSCCHSLRSYGLGDFWDRVTAILLTAFSLRYKDCKRQSMNHYCCSSSNHTATAAAAAAAGGGGASDDSVQESVLHAALSLLCSGDCPMTVAYLAVSVAHSTEARLVDDSNGRLPLHIAAQAVVGDDEDDDNDGSRDDNNHHHRVRWRRWGEDADTRRRKRKSRKHVRDIIQRILELYPHATRVRDRCGHIPFQLAEASGKRWDDGVGLLLYEYPRSVVVSVEEQVGKKENQDQEKEETKKNEEFQDVCFPHILSLVGKGITSSSFFVNDERTFSSSAYNLRRDDEVMVDRRRYCSLDVMFEILRNQPHLMCFV